MMFLMNLLNFLQQKKMINRCKLFHLQHGGSYGTSDDYPVEKIQMKLYDKFFSWGWSDKSKKNRKIILSKNDCNQNKTKIKKHPG